MGRLKITNVKAIVTAPAGINLVVVKVETSDPGLYGLGCATFTQRFLTVAEAVDEYMKPFLVGRDPSDIEDIWQTAMVSSYWRNGPVLNNAISGVDMALWDIQGKRAGMPVYQLLGGKCREAAAAYRHANGSTVEELEENVRRYMGEGYRFIRCQLGGYGGDKAVDGKQTKNPPPGAYYDPAVYARDVVDMFDYLRDKLGFEPELLHDVHERVPPILAVRMAKELEPHRLFFLEDPLAPEDVRWLETIRRQCSTPIAIGELFNNPHEWTMPMVHGHLDFIRVHISQIGGITPAKKLAALGETFAVRTAWHGPGDVSPVGHAANVHLDLACPNFGVQEWCGLDERLQEVFPGCPTVDNGYVYVSDAPGLGIDVDEQKAAQYPAENVLPRWTMTRTPDGSSVRP